MDAFVADYFPPGLEPAAEVEPLYFRGLTAVRRRQDGETLASLARSLRSRSEELRRVPAHDVCRTLGDLHAAWAAPESTLRAAAARQLDSITGYPEAVIDTSLQGLFQSMDAFALESWLASAGIPLESLDAEPSGAVGLRVFGPELTLVIASGNIPGAALPSFVQALLLKSPCLVKSASAEPVLFPLYAHSLARAAPELARGVAVTGWSGGDESLEQPLFVEAGAVVAYGSDEALRSIRDRLPLRCRFLPYGHRISVAVIGRESLGEGVALETARRTALDLAYYDQQGCLSPQAIYLEQSGEVSPFRFAKLLSAALETLSELLPRRTLTPAESSTIHQFRAAAEMRGLAGEDVHLWTSKQGTEWTVVLDPDPAIHPCCLNRTAVLHPLDNLTALRSALTPHRSSLISASVSTTETRKPELTELLASLGVTRITHLGQAQNPRHHHYHDGLNALANLARYVTTESDT